MFGRVFDFFAAGSLPHAPVEVGQFFERESVIQTHHRRPMNNGLKTLARRAADSLRRRVRRDQLGVFGLQLFELIHQPIVGGIGNFRVVRHMIEIFVVAKFFAKTLDLFCDLTTLGHRNPGRMQSAEPANYYTMHACLAGSDELYGPRHHRRAFDL